MRKILFRGKRLDNGEWIQGFLALLGDDYYIAPDINAYTSMGGRGKGRCMLFGHYYQVLPETVGQFTGLIDKNGKTIFEGDNIKIVPDYDYSDDYSISKVYSYNGILCVDYHGDDFDSTALGFLDDYLPDGDFEVIGNIHDNPKLLEVTK